MVTLLNLANNNHSIMDFPKKRATFTPKEQDPMSHRIIEKRRRDRMNNCLADLSRLIPPDYLKKGRGRIEKTEIIEMAIKHLKSLQERLNCIEQRESIPISAEHFRLGYQECLSEVMRYLVEGQGHFPRDAVCVQLINHLQRHCDNIMKGDVLNKPRCNPDSNSSSSGSSSNYMFHNQIPIPNNVQRILEKTLDMNNSERLHQHSNVFSGQNENKPINNEMEHSRLAPGSIDDSPEGINEPRDIYIEPNMSQMPIIHNGNFPGLKLVESNVDEGGGRNHAEFLRKVVPEISDNVENDCQTIQDLRVPNYSYSPLSPSYQHPLPGYQSHCEQTLRNIRKGVSSQLGDSGLSISSAQEVDNIHSYKYKNTIKQRFSQSQSTDYLSSSPSDLINYSNRDDHSFNRREQFGVNGKSSHKKRKISDHQSRHSNSCYDSNQYKDQSSSETNSSENISSVSQNAMFRSNKLQEGDLSNGRAREKEYLKQNQHIPVRHPNPDDGFSKLSRVGVPIFALHAKGSFYVPLNVDYDTLIPFLEHHDLLDVSTLQQNASLHPITISVNFQPKFYNTKHVPSLRTKSEHKHWP